MTGACRLYIASPDADAIERIIAFDPGFFTVGSSGGARALAEIAALGPDLAVIDGVLEGEDGIALLQRIGRTMPAPPRTVLLRRTKAETPVRTDAQIAYPCGADTLLAQCRRAAGVSLPALAAPWEAAREEIARSLLGRLRTPERMKGFSYLLFSAALCAASPGLLRGQTLYALLAERFATTPSAAEKAVRAAIEHTWLRGDWQEIQALFGLSVDAEKGKPTNLECIAMLAEHVRRALSRRMLREQA